MATPTTEFRGYQQPDPTNMLSQDVLRIAAAIAAIDFDVNQLFVSTAAAVLLTGGQSVQGVKTFVSPPLVPDLPDNENSNKAVNARFVKTAIAALLASAPAQLDTLNELAQALGDDPNFAATMTAALAGKAALNHTHAIGDVSGLNDAIASIIPTGTVWDYSLPTLPAGGWIWADGSALEADTPHQALRSAYINAGFPHGKDAADNPRVPDKRGRVTAGRDNMGGLAANRLTNSGSGVNGSLLGASGGAEVQSLTAAQMPSHNHGVTDPGHSHSMVYSFGGVAGGSSASQAGVFYSGTPANTASATTGITIQNNGSGQAHNNTQPTLVLNAIVKT